MLIYNWFDYVPLITHTHFDGRYGMLGNNHIPNVVACYIGMCFQCCQRKNVLYSSGNLIMICAHGLILNDDNDDDDDD